MSGLDAAATLNLAVTTGDSKKELEALSGLLKDIRLDFDALGASNGDPTKGIRGGLGATQTEMQQLLSSVKAVNNSIVAMSDDLTAKLTRTVREGANVEVSEYRAAKVRRMSLLKEFNKESAEQLKAHTDQISNDQKQQLEIYRLSGAEYSKIHAEALEMNRALDREVTAQVLKEQNQQLEIYKLSGAEYSKIHAEALEMNRALDRAATAQIAREQSQQLEIYKLNGVEYSRIHAEALAINSAMDRAASAKSSAQQVTVEALRMNNMFNGGLLDGAGKPIKELTDAHARLTPEVNKSKKATEDWTLAHRDAHDVARGLSGALGGLWMTYGQMVPLMAGFAIAASLKEALTAGKDFEYQMKFVQAVSGDTAQQIDKVSASLIQMASSGMFKPVEMAEGMRILAQAGMSTHDALATLPTVMALATVGETDLTAAAETATSVMHSFGLEISDIGHIGDVIARAAADSITSVSAMSQSMRQASTVGQQYGVHIEEVGAALEALAQRGIVGQSAGTSYTNMMNSLSAPTEKGQRALEKLRISLYDSVGNVKDMTTFMGELRIAMSKFDPESRNILGTALTTIRGNKALQAIVGQSADDWKKTVDSLKESNGFLSKSMEILQNTVSGQFKNMVSNVQASFISVEANSSEAIIRLIRSIKLAFTSTDVVDGLKTIANAVIGATEFIFRHIEAVKLIGEAYLVFHGARIAASVLIPVINGIASAALMLTTATAANTVGTMLQTSAMESLSPATLAAIAAVKALGVAMAANPATALLVAVAALWAGYELLVDKTNGATDAARNNISAADDAITAATNENTSIRGQIELLERELGLRQSLADEKRASIASEKLTLEHRIFGLEISKDAIAQGQKELNATGLKAPRWVPGSGMINGAADWLNDTTMSEEAAMTKELNDSRLRLTVVNGKLHEHDRDAKYRELLAGSQKFIRDEYVPEGQRRNKAHIDGLSGKGAESWKPEFVKSFDEQITNYSGTLSNLTTMESDALAVLKAQRTAGILDEKTYLDSSKALRSKYNEDANAELAKFNTSQDARIGEIEKALETLNNAKNKALSKVTNLKDRAAILKDFEASQERLLNSGLAAFSAKDKAKEDMQARLDKQKAGDKLEGYAGMASVYGDGSKQVRNAEELIRVQKSEIKSIEDLTARERDKNVVQMEGDLAKQESLLRGAAANGDNVTAIEGHISALQKLLAEYEAGIEKKKALDQDWVHGANQGIQTYLETTTSASKLAEEAVKKSFNSMADALTKFVMTGKLSFSSLTNSILSDLISMQVKASITNPLAKSVNDSGLFASIAKIFSAQGNAFSGAGLGAYSNSIVTSPTVFPFAQGIGLMGEKSGSPGEAIMPLQRNSQGDLSVNATGVGGANVVVNIINNSKATATATSRSDGNGGNIIDVMIDQIDSALAGRVTQGSGALSGAIQTTFGANRVSGAF